MHAPNIQGGEPAGQDTSSYMAPRNVSLALHFNNNYNYLDNSPNTYFLEKAFIKARAPRRGILVSKHCTSKSKTSLLTGLSNLEPLPVSPVADRTHLDHQDSWLRPYPKAICFSETGFPSVIPYLQP